MSRLGDVSIDNTSSTSSAGDKPGTKKSSTMGKPASASSSSSSITTTTHYKSKIKAIDKLSKREIQAAHIIQRAYKNYQLRKIIAYLQSYESWFFEWSRYSSNKHLQLDCLLQKITSPTFLNKIANLMLNLGFQRECTYCNAKVMLMGFVIHHHHNIDGSNLDPVMRKQIQNMGTTFLQVCEWPTCMFRRIRFLGAFCVYYQSFVRSRSKNTAYILPRLVGQMVDTVTIWHKISKSADRGLIRIEKCTKTLNTVHGRARTILDTLSCMTGSTVRAKQLVRLEMAKRCFLARLKQFRESDNASRSSCASTDAKNRQYRSVGMQLLVDGNFQSVHVRSREEKYDCCRDVNSVMRSQHHLKLEYIKQLVKSNFGLKQELWVPSFINHVRLILNMMDQELNIDDECVAQQCSLNCYELSKFVCGVISVTRAVVTTSTTTGSTGPASSGSGSGSGSTATRTTSTGASTLSPCSTNCSQLENEIRLELDRLYREAQTCVTQPLVCDYLDVLDRMRVACMDKFFLSNGRKLVSMTKHNELRYFVEDLNKGKVGIHNLLNWSGAPLQECKCLLAVDYDSVPSAQEVRLNKLKCRFSAFVTTFPSCTHLNEGAETLRLMRLTILRTSILIRDVVLGFSILHFAMGVSQDRSKAMRLKKTIMSILADDVRLAQSEIVNKLCTAVLVERPCLSDQEQKVLRGLVNRLVRKPGSLDDGTLDGVAKLALLRIRMAIQHQLLCAGDEEFCAPAPKLNFFEEEVSAIAKRTLSIWNASYDIYRPIYDTLTACDRLWGHQLEVHSDSDLNQSAEGQLEQLGFESSSKSSLDLELGPDQQKAQAVDINERNDYDLESMDLD